MKFKRSPVPEWFMNQTSVLAMVNLVFLIVVFLSVLSGISGGPGRALLMPRYITDRKPLSSLEIVLGADNRVSVNGVEADRDGLAVIFRHTASLAGALRITVDKSSSLSLLLQLWELAASAGITDISIAASP